MGHGHSPLWIDYGQQIGLKCLHSFDGFPVDNGGAAIAPHFQYFWFQFFFKDVSNCRHVESIQGSLEKMVKEVKSCQRFCSEANIMQKKDGNFFFGGEGE